MKGLRTKLVWLRLNFSWKSKASNIRQPKLSASQKQSVAANFRSVNVRKAKETLKISQPPLQN